MGRNYQNNARTSGPHSQPRGSSQPPPPRPPFGMPSSVPGSSFSMHDMMQILNRLDRRTIPAPQVFDLSSGQSLDRFFERFEEYCTNSYVGGPEKWGPELERFLTGEILAYYKTVMANSDPEYGLLRAKLTDWAASRHRLLKKEAKNRYTGARINPGESLSLYAARLENLYLAAHPHKTDVTNSVSLKNKFTDSVSSAIREKLQGAQHLASSVIQTEMTWQQLVVYATELELANKNMVRDDTSDIWLSQTATTEPDNSLNPTQQQQSPLPARHIRWSPQLQSSSCSNTVDDRANSASQQPICEFCGRANHLWEDCWR